MLPICLMPFIVPLHSYFLATIVEQLIQKVVNNYSLLVAKETMYERHLEARKNADMRDALTLVKIQIGMIESWFTLLRKESYFGRFCWVITMP